MRPLDEVPAQMLTQNLKIHNEDGATKNKSNVNSVRSNPFQMKLTKIGGTQSFVVRLQGGGSSVHHVTQGWWTVTIRQFLWCTLGRVVCGFLQEW